MPKRILVLNGPNMNLLGQREPHIYGRTTLAAVEHSCQAAAEALGMEAAVFQSNHEGAIVERIHEARESEDAIVINPAGHSFTSIAIRDALAAFEGPVIELHVSNIHARDEAHRHSVISAVATGVVAGLGVYGYIVAVQAAARMLGDLPDSLPQAIRVGPV